MYPQENTCGHGLRLRYHDGLQLPRASKQLNESEKEEK